MRYNLTLFRYITRRQRKKWKETVVLIFIIALSIFFPLQTLESYQNQKYIAVISQYPLSIDTVNAIKRIDGITYVAGINYDSLNDSIVFTATPEYKIFASKYIIDGRFPEKENEIVLVNNTESNHRIMLNRIVKINGSSYRIVGILSDKSLFGFSALFEKKDIFIHITHIAFEPILLYVGYSFFANETEIYYEIKSLTSKNTYTFMHFTPNIERVSIEIFLSASFISSTVIVFLIILSFRKDAAILFALGWQQKRIIKRVLLELVLIYVIGYMLCYFFLYFALVHTLRYYLFGNLGIFLYAAGLLATDLLSAYIFTRYLVFKKAIEVLTE